jgi:hypothetical protein
MAFSTKGKYVRVRQTYIYVIVASRFVCLTFRVFITCIGVTAEVMCSRMKSERIYFIAVLI